MISAALHAYAAVSQREWLQDRSATVGASEIGRCARMVYFSKNEGDAVFGLQRDAGHVEGWGARTRGSVFEDAFAAPAIKAAFGDRALFVGPDQRTFTDGFLSATPDGLLVGLAPDALAHLGVPGSGQSVLIDIKTVDPRTRLDAAKPEHVFQVQAGMGLVRAATEHRPDHAVLSYSDASFWDEGREFVVPYDETVFDEARRRARDIMTATSAQALRPEGVIAGGRECERCPFTAACGQARADKVPKAAEPIDPLVAESIADLAREARVLRDGSEADLARAKEIEHEVREMLAAAGSKRLNHGGVKVVWSRVKGRPSWDMKGIREAAEAAGVDLSKFERVGELSDRLLVTLSEMPADAGVSAAVAAE